ncbi:MAG: type II secretion system minor pseudopilin GspK [Pseudohongiella sp.]|nr:type II secretion system minor pseudopilin GspK [Pseudohongiella sp.]
MYFLQSKPQCGRKPLQLKHAQQGVAIIMAMAVVTLAALAATAIVVTQSTWARRVQLANDHTQAQLLIQTGLDWGRAVLSDDLRVSTADHAGEPWAMVLPAVSVDNGNLLGHIEDQQGRFNLNNLLQDGNINASQLEAYQRLLVLLNLPPVLALTLADWLDTDQQVQPGGGAEDVYYLALPLPYLAANRAMQDVAELADVAGYDAMVRARLMPFVTALPGFAALNVNMATAEVLAAVIPDLGLDGARTLVVRRHQAWFRNYADFISQLPQQLLNTSGVSLSENNLSVSSHFFIATAQVSFGGAQARGSALLARSSAGWPRVVWRKYQ